jgi:hypothetical protein
MAREADEGGGTRRYLEFTDHGAFEILRGRGAVDEALGQVLGVERLEHVLVFNVLEDRHLNTS